MLKQGDVVDGKYRIGAQLGEGGMGVVFEAHHLQLDRAVAFKVVRPEAGAVPGQRRRFRREARTVARLRSEHVVRVFDFGQLAGGSHYVVMELLDGRDLSSLLRGGPLPVASAADYIAQACDGLAEAHALGIVHRDIKPANLFLTRGSNGEEVLKLLDFGIATAACGDTGDKLTRTGLMLGTPAYMSPEQICTPHDVDARSDIFSLGITFYETLAGHVPFRGSVTDVMLGICNDPHPPIENIPPAMSQIVDRCLAKRPDERFASAAELAAALTSLAGGGNTVVPMKVRTPLPRAGRRRTWIAAIVVGLAIVATTVAVARGPERSDGQRDADVAAAHTAHGRTFHVTTSRHVDGVRVVCGQLAPVGCEPIVEPAFQDERAFECPALTAVGCCVQLSTEEEVCRIQNTDWCVTAGSCDLRQR